VNKYFYQKTTSSGIAALRCTMMGLQLIILDAPIPCNWYRDNSGGPQSAEMSTNMLPNASRAKQIRHKPLPIPEYPWQSVSMDFITHLPCTPRGNIVIVVFVDRLTKMVHFAPTTEKFGAKDFTEIFMTEIIRRHGLPETFISDRDPRFTSEFFASLCQHLGINQNMSTAFHPQTDGQTERTNRILDEMLRHYVGPTQDDWDLKLPCAGFAINNTIKRVTGHSPKNISCSDELAQFNHAPNFNF
jgi:hypothetical protein